MVSVPVQLQRTCVIIVGSYGLDDEVSVIAEAGAEERHVTASTGWAAGSRKRCGLPSTVCGLRPMVHFAACSLPVVHRAARS